MEEMSEREMMAGQAAGSERRRAVAVRSRRGANQKEGKMQEMQDEDVKKQRRDCARS